MMMAGKKDKYEMDILAAFEKGQLKRVKNAKQETVTAQKAASAYLKKDSRINIRLSGADLNSLRRRAVQEGIPYQTLISSIIHKFVTGSLVSKR
jgi:predicted DNA binding CopG/RHH family protein